MRHGIIHGKYLPWILPITLPANLSWRKIIPFLDEETKA